jgi:hypothetical protein
MISTAFLREKGKIIFWSVVVRHRTSPDLQEYASEPDALGCELILCTCNQLHKSIPVITLDYAMRQARE